MPWIDDLELIVDAVGVERFPLLGMSQGAAVAIAYAVRHPERVSHLIALSQSVLSELLDAFRAGEGVDLVRDAVRLVMQELIETEATEQIGAARYERTDTRITDRNGSRPRLVATQAGDIELRIPKLRKGSFFPSILEPRRRIDQALYAVVMEAYVNGVSTRSVDDLVAALGVDSGISKSEVSRICAGLDEVVGAFRTRRLDHIEFPYVYLDATYLHVRNAASQVTLDGRRDRHRHHRRRLNARSSASTSATPKTRCSGAASSSSLRQRGLGGVRLVISDQHAGLVAALRRSVPGRQPSTLPRALRPQPARPRPQDPSGHGRRGVPHDLRPTRRRHRRRHLGPGPRPARRPLPQDRRADGRRQSRSARLHRLPPSPLGQGVVHEPARADQQRVKRRARVVGIFPNEASVIRLVGAVLADMHDEWQAGDRRYLSDTSMAELYPERDTRTRRRTQHRRLTPRITSKPTTPRDAAEAHAPPPLGTAPPSRR